MINNTLEIPSKIVIIGNGFDLYNGIKSSYKDFINSEFFQTEDSNKLEEWLLQKTKLQNWIDIEKELIIFSKTDEVHRLQRENFYVEYLGIKNKLKNYLKSNISKIKLSKLPQDFERIFSNNDFIIYDFNYTPTTKILLEKNAHSISVIEGKIIKIHGDLDGEIIFGVDDKANIDNNHIFLKKSTSKNYKAIKIAHDDQQITELHIFGHSLGETDHHYFNSFFEKYSKELSRPKNPKKIYLYYFEEKGRLELYKQLNILTSNNMHILKHNIELNEIDLSTLL